MALTPSAMRPLGSALPPFALKDVVTQELVTSESLSGQPLLVAFICNHCPFVVHLKSALVEFGHFCDREGIQMIAVSSNSIESHPQDGPEPMAQEARQLGYPFPYLFDADQSVALAFDARCTPDFFLYDQAGSLVYRGQFDDTRPGKGDRPDGADLRRAVLALKAGEPPLSEQRPSIGCNIKWLPGKAPA